MQVEAGTASVGQVARLTGVTVRTLHHYDRIGLLGPAVRSAAGYRGYGPAELARLQRILAYRELGFGLAEIARLLDDPGADPLTRLRRQHDLVLERIERLARIAAVLERTMEAHAMGINLTAQELLEVFGDHDPAEHAEEARERWGETDAYRQSQARTLSYRKDDWLRIQAEQAALEAELAEALAAGLPADGPAAMDLADRHRALISQNFYDCPVAMHVGLAELYLADPRFTAHYEAKAPGLAQYLHDAILANAARTPAS